MGRSRDPGIGGAGAAQPRAGARMCREGVCAREEGWAVSLFLQLLGGREKLISCIVCRLELKWDGDFCSGGRKLGDEGSLGPRA